MIADVSDTSFWVAYYRAKETARPDALFRDPFAAKLIGTKGKEIADEMGDFSRYTEWSVVARTVTIDRFIEEQVRGGVDAVINLGAGLDARPYRMMSLPRELQWVEADYQKIIDHKNKVLAQEQPVVQLTHVAVDLADAKARREFLSGVVPNAKKVLVLTEGVIPYLTEEQVVDLGRDLASQTRFAFWITEYFHPRVYQYLRTAEFGSKMKNAPFQFYPADWFGFFRSTGWVEKETHFTGEIALEFHRKPPMPKWAAFIMPFLPRKVKEESMRMAGHTLLKRVE